jgi:hypothetical protein
MRDGVLNASSTAFEAEGGCSPPTGTDAARGSVRSTRAEFRRSLIWRSSVSALSLLILWRASGRGAHDPDPAA